VPASGDGDRTYGQREKVTNFQKSTRQKVRLRRDQTTEPSKKGETTALLDLFTHFKTGSNTTKATEDVSSRIKDRDCPTRVRPNCTDSERKETVSVTGQRNTATDAVEI